MDWITIENAKALAGPVATIIASIVAGLFARAQVRVARIQKDIAYDKLKFDLFEKRYVIYSATVELMDYILREKENNIDMNFIRQHYITLKEALFFFEPEIQAFLGTVEAECETCLVMGAEKDMMNPEDDPKAWNEKVNRVAEQRKKLRMMFSELQERFQNALEFKLLKSPRR